MQELIKVTEKNGEQLVSARELHEFLEVKKDFSDWIKTYINNNDYGFEEGFDYTTFKGNSTESTPRPRIEYILKLDMAKELAMLSKVPKGSQARKYFIACEKKLKLQKQLPETYIEALEQLLISEKKRVEVEKTNAILMHVNKNYTSTEIAKELGFKSASEFNMHLKDLGIQFKQNGTWVLYSKYSNLGYVDIKQNVLDNGKVVYDRKWTQLGREFILKKLDKDVI